MTIHSKWTTGGLEFYNTGTTSTALRIPAPNHAFAFGEQGVSFDVYFYGDTTGSYVLWDEGGDRLNFYYSDLNIYGAAGTEVINIDSSANLVDFSGFNITYNDPTWTTGSTGTITLGTTSTRLQSIEPSTDAASIMVKLPATSESAGIAFDICNVQDAYASLEVTTTGMGATTGTVLCSIKAGMGARFVSDARGWRVIKGSTG